MLNTLFINVQIWQDELYTLDKFVLVPLTTTIGDYHTTNNHIIFNLISNIYLRIIGIDRLDILLEHPVIIRVVPYIFTILSVWAFYTCAKKFQKQPYAIVSTGIFTTSLQLYTFGTQIRGYSLDILLSILLLYLLFLYHKDEQRKWLPLVTITGFLLLVNLPSTLYYFLSLIILIFLFRKRIGPGVARRLLFALCTAFILFAVFFATKSSQLAQNSMLFNNDNALFHSIKQPFTVIYRFIDWRFILVIPVIYFFFNKKFAGRLKISILTTGLLTLPFVLFMFHNLPIILRIWLILLPAFCFWFADWWMPVLDKRQQWILPFILFLHICLGLSLIFLRSQTYARNAQSIASTDLRWQYQLFNYNPRDVYKKALEKRNGGNLRISVDEYWVYGMLFYVRNENLLPPDSAYLHRDSLFLISQDANCFARLNIPLNTVIDSAKDNSSQFYKWYLIFNPTTSKKND